jgi:hypothetical protein
MSTTTPEPDRKSVSPWHTHVTVWISLYITTVVHRLDMMRREVNIACLKPETFEVAMQAYQILKPKLILHDIDQTDRDHEDNRDEDNYSIERRRQRKPTRQTRGPFWNYDDNLG